MASQGDVRRIALALPDVVEEDGHVAFTVRAGATQRPIAWVWLERLEPTSPRVPNPAVLAVRTQNVGEKEALIAAEPAIYFTEPHYDGYPAVLVRLDAIGVDELEEVIIDAWRCRAAEATGRRVRRYEGPCSRRALMFARSDRSPSGIPLPIFQPVIFARSDSRVNSALLVSVVVTP